MQVDLVDHALDVTALRVAARSRCCTAVRRQTARLSGPRPNRLRSTPLPVALANLVGEHVQDTELVMAGAVLTVVPVIVLFLALQRWYVAGITSGGVKG